MRRGRVGFVAILYVALSNNTICFASQEAQLQAQRVAEVWLALVDSGRYGQSWETAAALFKRAVTKEQWEHTIRAVREPFGTVESRQVQSQQDATSLPGAPDGQYVVMQFKTSFEHKASAMETVTAMVDQDGAWRVSGYYVR